MMIDDDTLKQLLRINDELMQLCKFLNEKRDMETSPIATARPYLASCRQTNLHACECSSRRNLLCR